MTIGDIILYHIHQAGEADACNEKEQAEMHTQMAVVLLQRLAS